MDQSWSVTQLSLHTKYQIRNIAQQLLDGRISKISSVISGTMGKKEYVSTLQERTKWTKESSNLKVGHVEYVMDDKAAPLQWPLARVSYVYSGPDNFVRVVKVMTSTGEYNRPVNKLKKLPLSDASPVI